MTPKVTIIIPVYNRFDLIGDTLNSIFNQTYTLCISNFGFSIKKGAAELGTNHWSFNKDAITAWTVSGGTLVLYVWKSF